MRAGQPFAYPISATLRAACGATLLALAACQSSAPLPQSTYDPDDFEHTDGLPCEMTHVADLPYQRARGHFLVDLAINDKPARLVFDTGSFHTLLTPAAAERLGLELDPGISIPVSGVGGQRMAMVRHADKILIGGLHTEKWQFEIADFGQQRYSTPVDGLLGIDVLRLLDIDLDVPGHMIRLYRPQHDCSRPSAVMHGPFYKVGLLTHNPWSDPKPRTIAMAKGFFISEPMPQYWPIVSVTIGNKQLSAVLDSGASRSLLFPSGAAKLGVTKAQIDADPHLRINGVGPNTVLMAVHTVPAMDLGDLEVQNVPLSVANQELMDGGPEMILGVDILQRIHVWISHSSHSLIMQFPPTPSPQTPIVPPAMSPQGPAART